jgi:TonB family protein
MKPTAGSPKPRRLATPKTPISKRIRLDLQRRPKPEPDDDLELKRENTFWKWVGLVALFHFVVISLGYLIYSFVPATKPPEQFISLLPQGDVVKGTPGTQAAHKVGATTSASIAHHTAPPPPPTPTAQNTPPPKPITPTPVLRPDSTLTALDKPTPKPPPKPAPPKPPKVKIDLHLADAPTPAVDKTAIKPKHHPKKPVEKSPDEDDANASEHDSTGLSKEEIAAKLGEKKDAAGVKDAVKSGTSGSPDGHPNSFSDFYASIRDQVMNQWQSPNLSDETAVNPVVQIHVEKDGRVPAESVHLIQSSGNSTYDDSALTAAKNLGYLHEPLPEGCPPDIPITFKLTR